MKKDLDSKYYDCGNGYYEWEDYGWWKVRFELKVEGDYVRWNDLTEATQDYILNSIKYGINQGEIVESRYEPKEEVWEREGIEYECA